MLRALLLAWVATAKLLAAQSGGVSDDVPARAKPGAYYVIYLHGRIIEDQGRRPSHPTWGIYEYDGILSALAGRGLEVISEHRRSGTDPDQFATRVAGQVRRLLAKGVPPERVAIVGFSKGGGIAIRAAHHLANDRLTFVFLGACGDGNFADSPLGVRGRILSIYEGSDVIGQSCRQLFERAEGPGPRSELRIDTGLEHGAFYQVRPEWLLPAVAWIKR